MFQRKKQETKLDVLSLLVLTLFLFFLSRHFFRFSERRNIFKNACIVFR